MKHSHRRRGRPSLNRPAKDKGTIQLQQKRVFYLTQEPLDRCVEEGIIDERQHRAGMRFRWLHSLRFTVPRPSAYDPDYLGGAETADMRYDPEWLKARSEEYREACHALEAIGARKQVSDVCIYLATPSFLAKHLLMQLNTIPQAEKMLREKERLVEGLSELVRVFGW